MGSTPPPEIQIRVDLVRQLIESQFPQRSTCPLRFLSSGWDNDIYRLGDDLAIRLPRRQAAVALIEHEQRWLPMMAKRLPVPVPDLIHVGKPEFDFPWPWSIVRWVSGTPVCYAEQIDLPRFSIDLARVLNAVHTVADPQAPKNDSRGIPLLQRDAPTRQFLADLPPEIEWEQSLLLERWGEALCVPPWQRAPLWLHGDVHPLNLLVQDGRLSGLIDFGDITSGDPATDLAVAWMVFNGADRESFRAHLRITDQPLDEATWARARGWALSIGITLLARSSDAPIYRTLGRDTVQRVLDDD